jgi:SAM-dependent methyltransferase
MTGAAERWQDALARWAIPQEILDRAPENPWHFPVQLFASRADHAAEVPTPSTVRALEALPEGGEVLDVGCGAGAAGLALAPKAVRLIGVDTSKEMLNEFLERARAAGLEAEAIEGRWPDIATRTPTADVVVCHHVAYNAPDLAPFVRDLTRHARHRVVMELTATHPMSTLNPLWLRFHEVRRPTEPTAEDAVEVLREEGLDPGREDWTAPRRGGFARKEDFVAWVRRLLCLPADRDPEIEQALADLAVEKDGEFGLPDRPVVTVWWPGAADAD